MIRRQIPITYWTIRSLFVLATAGVLGAGLLLITYSTLGPDHPHSVAPTPVDPETVYDTAMRIRGKNYTDVSNDDGTRTRRYYPVPIEYLTDDGEYVPIDTTVVSAAAGDGAYENTANTTEVAFHPVTDAAPVITFNAPETETYLEFPELPMTEDEAGNQVLDLSSLEGEDDSASAFAPVEKTRIVDRSVTFSIAGAAGVTPVPDGSTLTYPALLEGMDVRYTVVTDGLVEEIIAEEMPTETTYTQTLTLDNIYYKLHDDGSITFHDTDTKHIVFTAPRPVMYELESGKQNFGIHYELEVGTDDSLILHKVIDETGQAWLAEAAYPVAIDNTFYGIHWSNELHGEIEIDNPSASSSDPPTFGFNTSKFAVNQGRRFIGTSYYDTSIFGYTKDEQRYYMSFTTGSPTNVTVTQDQIIGATLNLYLYKTATLSTAERDLTSGTLNIYGELYNQQPMWTDVNDDLAANWYRMDTAELIGSLPYATSLSTLPPSNTETCAGAGAAQCKRTVVVPANYINGYTPFASTEQTQFILDLVDENVRAGAYYIGVVAWPIIGGGYEGTPPWPYLEVHYLPAPTIQVLEPRFSEDYNQLRVEITDTTIGEESFVLQRSPDGTSSWTNVCTARSGLTGSCGGVNGTYDCSANSKAGTGGTCVVTNTGLTADTPYWYRAQAYQSDVPSGYSPYSNIDTDWTHAQFVDTVLTLDSPAWNRLRVVGNGNTSAWAATHNNPSYTKYAFGIVGPFVNGVGYIRKFAGQYHSGGDPYMDLIDPCSSSPYPRACHTYTLGEWLLNFGFGISMSGSVTLQGTEPQGVWPGREHIFCEYAADTPTGYLHEPSIITTQCTYTYNRNRLPSGPTVAASTGNSVTLKMDITPFNSRSVSTDSKYTNPVHTMYAMAICDDPEGNAVCDNGSTWQYLRPNSATDRYATPQWYRYPITYSPRWQNGSPDQGWTYTGLSPATCYVTMAQSQNPDGSVGDGYATMSNVVQFCTPLFPPDSPDLVCGYDTEEGANADGVSDGYYCDLTIKDTQNPSPPYYYKVEYSTDNFSTVSALPTGYTPHTNTVIHNSTDPWILHAPNTTIRFRINSCSNSSRYFRVYAALNAGGTAASPSSPVKSDTLPPCQPSAPVATLIGTTNILWNITNGTAAQPVTDNDAYDTIFAQRYNNIGTLKFGWNQTNLIPNTHHVLQSRSCDSGNANNGFAERCGQWSSNSGDVWTYALLPNLGVDCNYVYGATAAADDYYCDVTILDTNPSNPIGPPPDYLGKTKYRLSYCVGTCDETSTWTNVDLNDKLSLQSAGEFFYLKNWATGDTVVHFEDDDDAHVACSATNTRQNYRIEVRNEENKSGPGTFTYWTATLPPCEPQSLNNTDSVQTTDRVYWTWSAPVNGAQVAGPLTYQGNRSGCSSNQSFSTGSTGLDQYRSAGYTPNTRCNITVAARDANGKVGRAIDAKNFLEGGYAMAHLDIETVTGVDVTVDGTNQISIAARSSEGTFSNTGVAGSGIRFFETTGHPNSATENGFTGYRSDTTETDAGLSPNFNYCYQAQSRNGNQDYSGGRMPAAPGECRYTFAAIPAAPIIVRAEDGTSASVAIRDVDDNPKGGGDPDTQYAVCVTKYDGSGGVEYRHYVRYDGSIDLSSACVDNTGAMDTSGYWGTYTNWGQNNGVTVALDPSRKYDFEIKARNGDAATNSPSLGPTDNAGCIAGQTCIGTGFGPKASLFLVRNNIVGWAWSSNLGWISTNCLNLYTLTGYGFSCGVGQDWGVNTFFEETRDINPINGYAWASSGRTIPQERWSSITQLNANVPAQTNFHYSADSNVLIDAFNHEHRVWAESWPASGQTKDIFYQRWDGREWVTAGGALGADNVSQTAADSIEPTLAFDTNGNPHITWIENGEVWHLRWNPQANNGFGAWTSLSGAIYEPGVTDVLATQINISGTVGSGAGDNSPSLAIDVSDEPHLAFKHDIGGGVYEVYYTEWNGANWVRPDNGLGFDDISLTTSGDPAPSLALEQGTGYPHIVWAGSGNVIVYRYWDGAGWTAEQTIQSDATNSPASPVIIMDSSNQPHVAFGEADGARYEWLDVYNACGLGASTWVTADCQLAQNSNANFNVNIGQTRYGITMRLDANAHPHVAGLLRGAPDSDQVINYRFWDPAANGGTGAWVTVSGDTGGSALEVSRQFGDDIRGVALAVEGNGDPHLVWGLQEADGTWNVYARYWDSGYGQSGAGWISFNTNVCANDTQRGCADNFDCNGAACIESAGSPPQTTDWTVQWGQVYPDMNSDVIDFAFDDVTVGGPYIWALVSGDADLLLQIDPDDFSVINTVDMAAVGASGLSAIIMAQNSLWLTATTTVAPLAADTPGVIFEINPATRAVDQTIIMDTCQDNIDRIDPTKYCDPVDIGYDPVSGDLWTANRENFDTDGDPDTHGNGYLEGSFSRFDAATGVELNCADATPGTTECQASHGNPASMDYDATTQSMWVGYESFYLSKLNPTNGSETVIDIDPYAYPLYGHVRIGALLYFPVTSYTTHGLGEFGTGGIMIVNPDTASIVDVVETGFSMYPQGISYDGRYIWLTDWGQAATCTNDRTIYCAGIHPTGQCSNDGTIDCNYDYQCGAGNICEQTACAAVGGGCTNPEARVFQYEASSLSLVDSYQVFPTSWHRSYDIISVDNTTYVSSRGYNGFAKLYLDTAEGNGFGYCFDQAGQNGQRYGECSDTGASCIEDADCNSGEHCIYFTCAHDSDCPNYVPTGADEQCKAIATASFSGITREVTGWARVLSLKEAGEALGFNDWGWIRLGGPYDDRQSQSGTYTLSGTEIDSQQFLGDPDVNPSDVQLYTLFGWGWQGALIPSARNNSLWLPHLQLSATGQAGADSTDQYHGSPSIVTDSIGDPHIAWTEYNETNSSYDIYYARMKRGAWESADGSAFVSGSTDPIATQVDVSNIDGVDALWPSLALTDSDIPYLAWQQGGTDIDTGEVYFSRWDNVTATWTTPTKVDDGGTPDLELDSNNNPHVTYRHGPANNSAIQYRWLNAGTWTDVNGGPDDVLEISARGGGIAHLFPKLELDGADIPHVVWVDGTQVYYEYWNGVAWSTADGTPGSLSVSAGIGGLLGIPENPQDPDLALYRDGRPGIVWRDPGYILYRQWDGVDWVTVSGDIDETNLWVNIHNDLNGELQRFADTGEAPQVVMDRDDQPHIVWGDDTTTTGDGDIYYRHWSRESDGGQGAWVTASGGYTLDPARNHIDDAHLAVAETPAGYSSSPSLALDQFSNPQVAWNEREYSGTVCSIDADCPSAYPRCFDSQAAPGTKYCVASNILYTKFTSGHTPTGIGWIEFIPAGALLGIPFIQTQYGDIYGGNDVSLAPPPAGSNQYTGTYLILSNGTIQGIAGNYASSQTGAPTSSLIEPGLDPLVPNYGLPFGPNALSKIDVDALITVTNGQNRFGHTVDTFATGDVDAELAALPHPDILDGRVYYYNGDATIDQDITISRGDVTAGTTGNGLIIIDGDLTINADIYYEPTTASSPLQDITEMPSAAFIVRGNVYVNSLVHDLSGVFVAIDADPNDSIESGVISTSRVQPVTHVIAQAADDTTVGLDGSVSGATTAMRFGQTATTTYRTLMRWQLDIPPGAEIRSAYIRTHSTGALSGSDYEARIYALDDPASVDFSNASAYNAGIGSSIVYDTQGWNSESVHTSPDIHSLVQRVVSDDQYASGDYFGVMLHEGNASPDDYKTLDAATAPTGSPAELVVEYSPRRTVYTVTDTADDVEAWGENAGDWAANPAADCLNVGWTSGSPYRSFFRFVPTAGYTEIPDNAEIIGAYLRLYASDCNADAGTFQLRQGLLDEVNISAGFGGVNPYTSIMSQSVAEVAEDIPAGAPINGALQQLTDSARLVQAWVNNSGYAPGHSIGIRLRRGGNETFAAAGQSRAYQQLNAEYHIDYQVPLHVSGLFIASGYNFDRKYTLNLEGAEQIMYDGRVVANTPPGLADFTKALPIYQRVTP